MDFVVKRKTFQSPEFACKIEWIRSSVDLTQITSQQIKEQYREWLKARV